jgi:hypothetical protein
LSSNWIGKVAVMFAILDLRLVMVIGSVIPTPPASQQHKNTYSKDYARQYGLQWEARYQPTLRDIESQSKHLTTACYGYGLRACGTALAQIH